MKATTESSKAEKAPAKKPTTGTPKNPRAKKADAPAAPTTGEPARKFARDIAAAARMVMPGLAFGRPGDADHLRQLANIKSWKELYNEKENFCQPLAGSAFIRAAMHTPGLFDDMQKELAKWSGEHLAFFNRGNPERIAAQLVLYGIDSGEKDFYLRTPKKWKANGYTVNAEARPIFVITPLFSDQEKEKAEQAGAAIVTTEATEATGKKRRKFYACHAVFATCDTVQIRVIKRRGPRKQKETAADYRAAAHATPAQAPTPEPAPAPAPRKAAPAKAADAFTPADLGELFKAALTA